MNNTIIKILSSLIIGVLLVNSGTNSSHQLIVPNAVDEITEINHTYHEQSLVYDLFVEDPLVYVADGYAGLVIYDYSNPTNPIRVGQYKLNWTAKQLIINGSYAFLLVDRLPHETKVLIIDISDPTDPVLLSSYVLHHIFSIAVKDSLLFIGSDFNDIHVVSLLDPSSPQLLTQIPFSLGSVAIHINGSRLVYASRYFDLNSYDITDINNPVENSFTGIGKVDDFYLDTHYIYAIDSDTFNIFDCIAGICSIVSSYSPYYPLESMEVKDNTVILTHGYSGLSIMDISNKTDLHMTGHILDHHAFNAYFSGSDAYIAGFDEGIYILDLNTFKADVIKGLDINLTVNDMVINGNYAYIAANDGHLWIYDISDPLSPVEENSYILSSTPYSVHMSIDALYVGSSFNITIFQFTDNPTELVNRGMIDLECEPPISHDIEVKEGEMYVASSCGILKFDVTDPFNPKYEVQIPKFTYEFLIEGDRLYYPDLSSRGIVIVDILDNPKIVGLVKSDALVTFEVTGNTAYVVDDKRGLSIVDVSDHSNPVELSNYQQVSGNDLWVNGSYLYVLDSDRGMISIFEIQDVYNPKLINYSLIADESPNQIIGNNNAVFAIDGVRFYGLNPTNIEYNRPKYLFDPLSDYYIDIIYRDSLIYTASYHDGLIIYDVSDENNPVILGSYTSRDVNAIELRENYCYLVSKTQGLEIVDISDPTDPLRISHLELEDPMDISLFQNYLYILDQTVMKVINISDITHPHLVTSFDLTSGDHILVNNDYVYVTGNNELKIVDISDIQNIVLLSTYTSYAIEDIAIQDKYAYLANGEIGMSIVDISQPTNPMLVKTIDSKDTSIVTISGDYAYIGNRQSDVSIIDCSDLNQLEILDSIPVYDPKKIAVNGNHSFVADSFEGIRILHYYNPTNQPTTQTSTSTTFPTTSDTSTSIGTSTGDTTDGLTTTETKTITKTNIVYTSSETTVEKSSAEETDPTTEEEVPLFFGYGLASMMMVIILRRGGVNK